MFRTRITVLSKTKSVELDTIAKIEGLIRAENADTTIITKIDIPNKYEKLEQAKKLLDEYNKENGTEYFVSHP